MQQTIFDASRGNAMQACVATLLGCERLDEVPNFMESPAGFYESIDAFLRPRQTAFLKVDCTATGGKLHFACSPGTRCVVAGKSPRGDHKHCVVGAVGEDGKSLVLQHDPYPEGGGIAGAAVWAGFLVRM
ncbi:hypothetical protein DIPPA_08699 [Diplonema papillatum]|nr:hypothetical protein DIPPA_08699 [Diplonema papillatum]